ncbi:MAG: hypothetical protein U0L58_07360 [Ruminococcus sp.]|nr:hypothetical protein [Ruminococcus sp.]MEE0857094.1 hypothetical protein [Ruminococcus sp.]
MSTKELAYSIFSRLNEEQLKGFIAMFKEIYPVDENSGQSKKDAFEKLQNLRRTIPDLDEKKELDEYRSARYGK